MAVKNYHGMLKIMYSEAVCLFAMGYQIELDDGCAYQMTRTRNPDRQKATNAFKDLCKYLPGGFYIQNTNGIFQIECLRGFKFERREAFKTGRKEW